MKTHKNLNKRIEQLEKDNNVDQTSPIIIFDLPTPGDETKSTKSFKNGTLSIIFEPNNLSTKND